MSARVVLCLLGMALLVQVHSGQSAATTAKPSAETTNATTATTKATTPTTTPTTNATTPTTKPTTPTTKPTTAPTTKPTTTPTTKPTTVPTTKPTTKPTTPTTKPTTKPTTPTTKPTTKPTTPTTKPTTKPTTPTTKPTTKPTTPTTKPTTKPTGKPTTKPTGKPTTKPTGKPTTKPTGKPTTKPAPTTTQAPTTTPVPVPRFAVMDDNVTCILMDAHVSLSTGHHGKHHTSQSFDNSNVTGSCNETHREIELQSGDLMLQLRFHINAKAQSWSLSEIVLVENMSIIANGSSHIMAHHNQSYECGTMKVDLRHDHGKHFGAVTLRDLHIQAYDVHDDEFSSDVSTCPNAKPSTNNTVPIAVGAALAALVVCVIVAYVIGRSRSSRRGYQAV